MVELQLQVQIEKVDKMPSATNAELFEKLVPVVAQIGLELDDLKLSKAGKYRVLEIAVDGDEINLDLVADASRAISEFLDNSTLMGEQAYTLEVTTRGVDRPLLKPQHWSRNIGRLVKVSGNAINETGRIKSFNDPVVTLEIKGKDQEINTSEISSAVVQVEFKQLNNAERD